MRRGRYISHGDKVTIVAMTLITIVVIGLSIYLTWTLL